MEKLKILIVEDDKILLALYDEFLEYILAWSKDQKAV